VLAEIAKVRITNVGSSVNNSMQIVGLINSRLGVRLSMADFQFVERVDLATMKFEMWVQTRAGKPIVESRLRVWRNKQNQIIAIEAHVDRASTNGFGFVLRSSQRFLQPQYLENAQNLERQKTLVKEALKNHHDNQVIEIKHEDAWEKDRFVRIFTATGERGVHTVSYGHVEGRLVSARYQEHHQAELPPVEAMGYKVYEQNWYNPSEAMAPEVLQLKYLNDKVVAQDNDPFEALTKSPFMRHLYDEQRGSTQEGIQQGFWSYALLNAMANEAQGNLQLVDNSFTGPKGLVLDGRYVSINIHPGAKRYLENAALPLVYSANIQQDMVSFMGQVGLSFKTALLGRTYNAPEGLMVTPVRHATHSVSEYLKDGVDQVQVYWAVTEMLEKLQGLGFTDPEISSRKFTAYLYNPDPFYRNNAFYINDTINFTTYSPEASNFARDNTTIWHEIGHGIIDRLLGQITLVKGEGFHEGMADFLAELVLQASSFGREFPGRTNQRIYNVAAFNFANEAHDDGEAFGGFMKEVLDKSIEKWGENGVSKMANLIFEAMRFTRGHPALDEQEWVEKMLFADSRGNLMRAAGDFRALIEASLAKRNFSADGKNLASMEVQIDDQILRRGGQGGRNGPIYRPKDIESRMALKVRLNDGANFKFKYPLKIKVAAGNGAKGPIDWIGEEEGPKFVNLNSAADVAEVEMGTTGKCDVLNLNDTCRESVFIEVYEEGDKKPKARQRIYIQLGLPPIFG
jgi:hypothetical protein